MTFGAHEFAEDVALGRVVEDIRQTLPPPPLPTLR